MKVIESREKRESVKMKTPFRLKTAVIVIITALMLSAVACGAEESAPPRLEDLEITLFRGGRGEDRLIFRDIEMLVKHSDLVVIGEFIEDARQTVNFEYDSRLGKEVLQPDFRSTNILLITEVLQGSIDTDRLEVSQSYAIVEQEPGKTELISWSGLTPMRKGDRWLYFFTPSYGNEDGKTYWFSRGDYSGRYPLPNEKLLEAVEKSLKLKEELKNWLSENAVVITDEAERTRLWESGEDMYIVDGVHHHIKSAEEWGVFFPYFVSEYEKITAELNPFDFGVLENQAVNLWLYDDVLKYFDLY